MKQETPEEAAERYSSISFKGQDLYDGFIEGAKWQAERIYSEEEVHNILTSFKNNKPKVFLKVFYNKWFEQFKK